MPGINVHLTFTCKIFQGLCFPCHASRDQSAPQAPARFAGFSLLSPCLRRCGGIKRTHCVRPVAGPSVGRRAPESLAAGSAP